MTYKRHSSTKMITKAPTAVSTLLPPSPSYPRVQQPSFFLRYENHPDIDPAMPASTPSSSCCSPAASVDAAAAVVDAAASAFVDTASAAAAFVDAVAAAALLSFALASPSPRVSFTVAEAVVVESGWLAPTALPWALTLAAPVAEDACMACLRAKLTTQDIKTRQG